MSPSLTRGVGACVVECRDTGPHCDNCGRMDVVGKKRSKAHPGGPAKKMPIGQVSERADKAVSAVRTVGQMVHAVGHTQDRTQPVETQGKLEGKNVCDLLIET